MVEGDHGGRVFMGSMGVMVFMGSMGSWAKLSMGGLSPWLPQKGYVHTRP